MPTTLITGVAVWYGLHVIYDCPVFLFAPSLSIFTLRLKAIFGLLPSTSDAKELQQYKMPSASKKIYLFRMFLMIISLPLMDILWLLDEILYGKEYRKVSLDKSVFVVGGFRTGTTSLHRALAMDEERYTSPRFIEVVYPFLLIQKFFDWLEHRDKVNGTQTVRNVEKKLHAIIGEENMARHPMSWYVPEEDDLLLASWHYIGWYTGCTFPHPEALMIAGQQSKHSAADQKRSFEFYKRSMQKFMYRRGNGRALLAKNHMIDFMPQLAKELPDAKFVDIVRHPKDAFTSWYGLAQGALGVLAQEKVEQKTMVQCHLRFWDKFCDREKKFFGEEGADDPNRSLVTFKEYIKEQEGTVRKLYKQWGYEVEGTKFEERLIADRQSHKQYKSKAAYKNPSLDELGVDVAALNERYADYLTTCKII